jgi:transposase-like protein
MDAQATFSCSFTQSDVAAAAELTSQPHWPAQRLLPQERRALAVEVLAGAQPVSDLARQHEVSRKFLYQQAQTAQQALEGAFNPSRPRDDVLFYLPVTKAWLEQLVLGLTLTRHSSCRGVVELLRDLFDFSISVGNVSNIVHSAVAAAQRINQQYDLADIHIGAHDEIYQASDPVLVGVDTASTFCYLLSLEEHCDAETWGIRLLELVDRGFAPDATVGDGGTALRAGQELALPGTPCRGDHFHLFRDFEKAVGHLERRVYEAIDTCEQREREQARCRRQGKSLSSVGQRLHHARAACDPATALHDDVSLLLRWLRHDILGVAGPSYAERCTLYDFVVAELRARVPLCPHRLQPIYRSLENGRHNFLAFANQLDVELNRLAIDFRCSAELLRRVLQMLCRTDHDRRRWTEETALRQQLRGRFWEVRQAVSELRQGTVRASSLVENLNSRLRSYFFLRRQLGADYLSLLQFFLNHRRLERSERPERVGRSPAELLTGQPLPHWLDMLGYSRFQRN